MAGLHGARRVGGRAVATAAMFGLTGDSDVSRGFQRVALPITVGSTEAGAATPTPGPQQEQGPALYIGSCEALLDDGAALRSAGVTHVLSVMGGASVTHPLDNGQFRRLVVESAVLDDPTCDLRSEWPRNLLK